jgi:hypothetical protein
VFPEVTASLVLFPVSAIPLVFLHRWYHCISRNMGIKYIIVGRVEANLRNGNQRIGILEKNAGWHRSVKSPIEIYFET